MNERLSAYLDLSRWFAAFLVLIGHARAIVLVDYQDVASKDIVDQVIYLATGFGHEAVVVFFVASGFLVGGLSLTKVAAGRFDLLDYSISRFSRIYIVLVPALIVGALLDWLGVNFAARAGHYSGDLIGSVPVDVFQNLQPIVFVGNLLSLQTVAVPVLGSNGPLWSLAFEWWYYVIFAALVMAFIGNHAVTKVVAIAALVVSLVVFPGELLLWGTIWAVGAAACLWVVRGWTRPPIWLTLPVLFVSALVLNVLPGLVEAVPNPRFAKDFIVGVTFALTLVSMSGEGRVLPFPTIHKRLADFSYSLYLVHFPLLVLISAVLASHAGLPSRQQPGLMSFVYMLGLIGVAFLYAYAFSQLTERHTMALRRWLKGRFAPPAPAKA